MLLRSWSVRNSASNRGLIFLCAHLLALVDSGRQPWFELARWVDEQPTVLNCNTLRKTFAQRLLVLHVLQVNLPLFCSPHFRSCSLCRLKSTRFRSAYQPRLGRVDVEQDSVLSRPAGSRVSRSSCIVLHFVIPHGAVLLLAVLCCGMPWYAALEYLYW